MTLSRTLTLVAGMAAAGAAGAGVASWWQDRNAEPVEMAQSEGFSAAEVTSIEGIVASYLQANPPAAPMSSGSSDPESFTAPQTEAIGQVVRSYLLENPEIMRDVFQALEAKEEQQRDQQARSFIAENAEALFGGTPGLTLGNPDGDVTIVEFFDYNCGYCKRALDDLQALLKADPDLKVVMKEFPILSPGSIEAAKVSLAVARQGRYFDFHSRLLSSPGSANGDKALRLAEELGLDMARLQQDLASDEIDAEIEATMDIATRMGIRGTPAYVVGTEVIPGAVGFENLRDKIAEVREKTCVNC